MNIDFYQEEKDLFQSYINSWLFKKSNSFSHILLNLYDYHPRVYETSIEIIVRPECNQKCEYCYIARYGKDLYPLNERVSNEELLKNLDALLYYVFIENDTYVNKWDLFAGDLFYDDLYFNIVDIFYKYLSQLYKKYPMVFKKLPLSIVTPSNFSFMRNEEKSNKLEEYIKKFAELNCELGFSISTDGIYATDTREQQELDEEFTNKLFKFVDKYRPSGMHPMISPSNVHNAIKNYDWFRKKYHEFLGETYAPIPMFLEVRNDEWTFENIKDLIELENHMIQDRLEWCNNDIDLLARHLWGPVDINDHYSRFYYNDIINLYIKDDEYLRQKISCSMQETLHIMLNNLSCPICHRLTYKQFQGGKFLLNDDNRIYDVQPINPSGYLSTKFFPMKNAPRCIHCPYESVCHLGCLGAQYEALGELFIPANSVCQMKQAKINNLVMAYYDMGVFHSATRQGLFNPQQVEKLNQLLEVCGRKGDLEFICKNC